MGTHLHPGWSRDLPPSCTLWHWEQVSAQSSGGEVEKSSLLHEGLALTTPSTPCPGHPPQGYTKPSTDSLVQLHLDHLKRRMSKGTAEVSGVGLRMALGWCPGGAKQGWALASGNARETEPGGTILVATARSENGPGS